MATPGLYCGVKRGDVFYIRMDNGFGSEMAVGRPVVIVSNNRGNDTSGLVQCIFLTTSPKKMGTIDIPLTSMKRKSWALCNQIYTYDRNRLGDYMCTLTEAEMESIDAGLAVVLGLSLENPADEERHAESVKEIVLKHTEELAALKEAHTKEIEAVRTEMIGKIVDYELLQRKYEYAMGRLTTLVVGRDTAEGCRKKEEEPAPVVAEPVAEEPEPVEEEPGLVDINRCSVEDLTGMGFGVSVAKMIEAARPFMTEEELKRVPGVTRIAYQIVEKKITVGDTAEYRKKPSVVEEPKPVEEEPVAEKPEKVNVNTVSGLELHKRTGIAKSTAYTITGWRNKNRLFTSVEDMLVVPVVTERFLKRYGDLLTV